MTLISLSPSIFERIDEIGMINHEITRLKNQRDDMAAIVKLTGAGRYCGQWFDGLVYTSKGSVKTDWKAVATHFSPSIQLLTAHTSTGDPTISLKVTGVTV